MGQCLNVVASTLYTWMRVEQKCTHWALARENTANGYTFRWAVDLAIIVCADTDAAKTLESLPEKYNLISIKFFCFTQFNNKMMELSN